MLRYGFIPNGGRVYYLRRSQPPLFAGMIYEYIEATKDFEFLKTILPAVIEEFRFWQNNRYKSSKTSEVQKPVVEFQDRHSKERKICPSFIPL